VPPVSLLGSAIATYATGTLTFITPLSQPGEVLLVVIAGPSTIATVPPVGWELLATQNATTPAARTSIYRRSVSESEPAAHQFALGAATPNPCGIMLRYREVDASKAIVVQSQQARGTANISHTPPAVTATNYSDLMLLVYYGLDAAGTASITPPAGTKLLTTEAHGASGGGSLAVCELLLESASSTGSRTGVWSSAVTGIAACYGLAANPVYFAQPLQAIPGGGIGLPVVGI
jgi:hypothetical protein